MPSNDNHNNIKELFENDDMGFLQDWTDAVRNDEPDEAQWQAARSNLAASLQAKTKENVIMKAIRNTSIGNYRWAAVTAFVVLIFAVIGAIGIWDRNPELVFAEVLEQIRTINSFHYTCTTEVEGQTFVFQADYMDPGKTRMVMPDGNIMIQDMAQGKSLTLTPAAKIASVVDFSDDPNLKPQENIIESMRKLEAGQEEHLGQKEVDGKLVYGFRVGKEGHEFEFWCDLRTGLPVRVEMQIPAFGAMKTIMTDFQYNIELDESLFSVEPPVDYELIDLGKAETGTPVESDLIESLKLVISEKNKSFPETLDLMGLSKLYGKSNSFKSAKPSNEEIKTFALAFGKLARGAQFAQMNAGNDWHYEPEGKTFGSNEPLCWWKPEGSETYRVIYCDLTAADVLADEFVNG